MVSLIRPAYRSVRTAKRPTARDCRDVAQHLEREQGHVDDAVVRLVDRHAVEGEERRPLVEAAHVDARLAAPALADVKPGHQLEHVAKVALVATSMISSAINQGPRRKIRVDRARPVSDLDRSSRLVLLPRGARSGVTAARGALSAFRPSRRSIRIGGGRHDEEAELAADQPEDGGGQRREHPPDQHEASGNPHPYFERIFTASLARLPAKPATAQATRPGREPASRWASTPAPAAA